MVVRRETIWYAIARAKQRKTEEVNLLNHLKDSEARLEDPTVEDQENVIGQYRQAKSDYEQFEAEKIRGYVLRSKSQWAEEGERSSKFFLNSEKYNQEIKSISLLCSDDGIENTTQQAIQKMLFDFYAKLYSNNIPSDTQNFDNFEPEYRVSEVDNQFLETAIGIEECKEALDQLAANKIPGSDGLTVEFFKKFWPKIAQYFYDSLCMSVVREANKLFYVFLWGNKPDKLKRDIITRDIKAGGLEMVDVETMIYSLKIKWAKKLYTDTTNKWTNIVDYYFKPISIKHFMTSNYIEEYLPPLLPQFYRQCLIALLEVKPCYDQTVVNNVLLQKLWFNSKIQIANKPVFYKHWYTKGIKSIGDIVDKNGLLLLPDQIQQKFDLDKIHFLEYYALRNAIPFIWKNTLRTANKIKYVEDHSLDVELKGISRDLKYTSNKEIYWSMITKNKTCPIPAERYWIRSFGVPEAHMKKYYEIPYLYMRQTKIQTMQYKILHNFYACNLKLYKWKIVHSNKCLHCETTDTLEHHFFECVHMQVFWRSFCGWWKNYCMDCCPNDLFTCKQVILGVIEKVCHKPQLNYLLLLAKWYVFKVKHLQGKCFFLDFLSDVKTNLNIEQSTYKLKNNYIKYLELWYELHVLL